MRTLKKTLCLVLALVMILGLGAFSVVSADDTTGVAADEAYSTAKAVLNKESGVGAFIGDGKGNYSWGDSLVRQEAAVILARLGGLTDAQAASYTSSYTDVTDEVYNGYIGYAETYGYIVGNGDGTFGYDQPLTGYAFALMLARVLGYNALNEGMTADGSNWEVVAAKVARAAGLDEGLSVLSKQITREQAAQFALNALKANTVTYATSATTITTSDGTTIVTGASKATKGATLMNKLYDDLTYEPAYVNYATYEGDSTQYGDDVLSTGYSKIGHTDEFGVPTSVWTYEGEVIATEAAEAAATFTTKVDVAEATSALKGYSIDKSENNAASLTISGPDGATYEEERFLTKSALIDLIVDELSANGTKIQVFASSGRVILAVSVVEYGVEKSLQVATTREGVEYTVNENISGTIYNKSVAKSDTVKLYDVKGEEIDDIKAGAVVTYTRTVDDEGLEVLHIYETTKLADVSLTSKTEDKVTNAISAKVDGTSYPVAAYNLGVLNSTKTGNWYIDQLGTIVYNDLDETEIGFSVLYITGTELTTNYKGEEVESYGIEGRLDGAAAKYDTYKAGTKIDEFTDDSWTTGNRLYKVVKGTVTGAAEFETAAKDATKNTPETKKGETYVFGSDVVIYIVNNDYEETSFTLTVASYKEIKAGDQVLVQLAASSDTASAIYVLKDAGETPAKPSEPGKPSTPTGGTCTLTLGGKYDVSTVQVWSANGTVKETGVAAATGTTYTLTAGDTIVITDTTTPTKVLGASHATIIDDDTETFIGAVDQTVGSKHTLTFKMPGQNLTLNENDEADALSITVAKGLTLDKVCATGVTDDLSGALLYASVENSDGSKTYYYNATNGIQDLYITNSVSNQVLVFNETYKTVHFGAGSAIADENGEEIDSTKGSSSKHALSDTLQTLNANLYIYPAAKVEVTNVTGESDDTAKTTVDTTGYAVVGSSITKLMVDTPADNSSGILETAASGKNYGDDIGKSIEITGKDIKLEGAFKVEFASGMTVHVSDDTNKALNTDPTITSGQYVRTGDSILAVMPTGTNSIGAHAVDFGGDIAVLANITSGDVAYDADDAHTVDADVNLEAAILVTGSAADTAIWVANSQQVTRVKISDDLTDDDTKVYIKAHATATADSDDLVQVVAKGETGSMTADTGSATPEAGKSYFKDSGGKDGTNAIYFLVGGLEDITITDSTN